MKTMVIVIRGLSTVVLIGAISGCSWFGWGVDKKIVPLAELKSGNDLTVSWSASTGKSNGYLFVPGVGDKLIFAAIHDKSVYALAEDGGRQVARLDLQEKLTAGVGASDNLVVVANNKGEVVAMDASGRALWKGLVGGEILAAPVVAQTNVVVRTSDGRIVGLNRIDGKRKWVYPRAAPPLTLRTNASVWINRGVIYAGYPGGKVVAVELETGKPVWEATISLPRGSNELERIADVAGVPVLDDTRICASVYQGRTGCLETLNGNLLWSREISSADGVAIDTKYLYVADLDGNVYALDKTSGSTVWKQDKLQHRDPGTPITIKGKVLIGDKTGTVHALSPENGVLTGRIATDGSRIVSLIANGDRAIAQTEKGGIFTIAVK